MSEIALPDSPVRLAKWSQLLLLKILLFSLSRQWKSLVHKVTLLAQMADEDVEDVVSQLLFRGSHQAGDIMMIAPLGWMMENPF